MKRINLDQLAALAFCGLVWYIVIRLVIAAF